MAVALNERDDLHSRKEKHKNRKQETSVLLFRAEV